MAFNIALSKAKSASQYTPPTFEAERSFTFTEKAPESDSKLQTFNEIWALTQKADALRVQIEAERLSRAWENPLSAPEILLSLQNLERQLVSVVSAKDACLSILRNPVSLSVVNSNSLSLKRDRQAELVDLFEILVMKLLLSPEDSS